MNDTVELRDLRAKLTVLGDQVLDAVARAEGRDKSEVVREVIHAWALQQIHRSQLIVRLSRGHGEGTTGRDGE